MADTREQRNPFDFLGFTLQCEASHWEANAVLHRTSRKEAEMKEKQSRKWLWEHIFESTADTIEALNETDGHYRYYGILWELQVCKNITNM